MADSGCSLFGDGCGAGCGARGYIYGGGQLVAAYGNGAAPSSPSREYAYSGRALLAKSEGGAMQYYHQDQSSVRVMTNSSGSVSTCAGGTVVKLYWRSLSGDALAETDGSGSTSNGGFNEYIFFNGSSRIARLDSSANVYYYFGDHLGSARVITNASGSVCYDSDFYPFGVERSPYTNICTFNNYKFTGKERDSESYLDNFGARYDASRLGRFISVDPHTSTPLHIINPQRWNMYAYGVDNPSSFVDPDGKDAIAVNFSTQDPLVGHEGIISVDADGTATYARFGPTTTGAAFDKGAVTSEALSTKVQFGKDGLPTPSSYASLTKEVAGREKQDPSTVRMNYFKTSTVDTLALDKWIATMQALSSAGLVPGYSFCTLHNCAGFVQAGLIVGGAITPFQQSMLSIIPNVDFYELDLLDDQTYVSSPKTKVSSLLCHSDNQGNWVCDPVY